MRKKTLEKGGGLHSRPLSVLTKKDIKKLSLFTYVGEW